MGITAAHPHGRQVRDCDHRSHPVRDGNGPARLLDTVEGRTKQVFATWLEERRRAWRDKAEVVAMDGFAGYKTTAVDKLPDAVEVMDPVQ